MESEHNLRVGQEDNAKEIENLRSYRHFVKVRLSVDSLLCEREECCRISRASIEPQSLARISVILTKSPVKGNGNWS